MTTLLLTAFEPFGGEDINPSWEIARTFDKQWVGDTYVVSYCLPCIFGESLKALERAIIEVKPDIVISLGQAGGRPDITPERIAINFDDARIADNAGNQPIDTPVDSGGAAAYFTTLPVKAIVQALHESGVPASVSYTAGTFVCNHVFYGLQQLAIRYGIKKSGFVHIPYLTQQATKYKGQPSMNKQTLVDGLCTMIETVASTNKDVLMVGGETH
jgi:pyroglutamyl-peptidase